MRIHAQEICDEMEALEHRRARLGDLLQSGSVSGELDREVRNMVAEVERQMRQLKPRTWVVPARIAA
jgi:hypothetical protein